MLHVTKRTNSDGIVRYYFKRRGYPMFRLYGEPNDPEFVDQYQFIMSRGPFDKPPHRGDVRKLQAHLDSLRRQTEEDKKYLAASRLARSVNSRARHQYQVCSEITTKWILDTIERQDGKCAVSGIPFSYDRGLPTKDRRNPRAPSVDRIDNARGYEKRNCRIVILAVNIALNLWGDELFLEVCQATLERSKTASV